MFLGLESFRVGLIPEVIKGGKMQEKVLFQLAFTSQI